MSNFEANLGCASTEELYRELIVRHGHEVVMGTVGGWRGFQRAVLLAEQLGSLDATEREYRTVDQ